MQHHAACDKILMQPTVLSSLSGCKLQPNKFDFPSMLAVRNLASGVICNYYHNKFTVNPEIFRENVIFANIRDVVVSRK